MGSRKGFLVPDPYQIEIMDAVARPGVKKVTFCKPVQIGYTTILLAILGWAMDLHGHQVLMVQPNQETAKKFMKDRGEHLIDYAPGLASRLVKHSNSSSGSTVRDKYFSNGAGVFVASAKADKELRMFSSSLILLDERSTYEVSIGSQGDPAKIAEARGEVFQDLVVFQGSTLVHSRGRDPIELDYLESSQAKYHIPCPFCNGLSTLPWRDEKGNYRLIYDLDAHRKVIPESVRYLCIHCDREIFEDKKVAMVDVGQWIHARPEVTTHLGYHMTSLMSVVKQNWPELAQQWVDAKDNRSSLKSFLTLKLAESWMEPGSQLDASTLQGRVDPSFQRRTVPDGAGVVVAFVDVQGSWLEGCIWAFGVGMECWLIDWFRADGDTSRPEVYEDVDAWLLEPLKHINGRTVPLDLVLFDTGFRQGAVYDYVLPRQSAARRVFASKGTERITSLGLARESTSRKGRARLFLIATDATKHQAMGQLNTLRKGPGYVHLPGWVTPEFLKGLASERHEEVEDPRDRTIRAKWIKIEDRNEVWDTFVGAIAAVWILQNLWPRSKYRDLGTLAAALALPPEGDTASLAAAKPSAQPTRTLPRPSSLRGW
jgi:phage terminase large subunit GpA-like protein